MHKPEIEIELAIEHLLMMRDRAHHLEDLTSVVFTGNFFRYISILHKELSDHKKSIGETNE